MNTTTAATTATATATAPEPAGRYRCPACAAVTAYDGTDASGPTCSPDGTASTGCGVLLYVEDLVPARNWRPRFELIGSPADFYAGEEREYRVIVRDRNVGTVGVNWEPGPVVGGELIRGWACTLSGGKSGYGRTRAAAANAALND